jgi:formylglycine-generating enzyme required for sulfatase activity
MRSTIVLLLISLVLIVGCVKKKEPVELAGAMEMEMVLIPGGEFFMGSEDGGDDEVPVHKVYVDSFYMDKYEVTNAQYFKFCRETERDLPEFWEMEEFHSGLEYPNHPVIGVSWRDAKAYAEWAGKRLPTEAEWEYAARGGLVGKRFPSGDDLDTSVANFASEGTVPVGSYPPNGFGLHDVAGNVAEWVSDYYHQDYYRFSPQRNATGPQEGKFRGVRGGGWHSGKWCCSVNIRNGLIDRWVDFNVGFRCAKDIR